MPASFQKAGEELRRLKWVKEGQFEKMKNCSAIHRMYLKVLFIFG
jgi:hypothetical protein